MTVAVRGVSREMSAFPQSPKHEEFIALFVRHEPAIHSFLTALLANLDDAEVVMQETSMAMCALATSL